jgi:hypothetical protein
MLSVFADIDFPEVVVSNLDSARGRIVKAHQHCCYRTLAASRRPYNRGDFTGLEGEVDVLNNLDCGSSWVDKRYILEGDVVPFDRLGHLYSIFRIDIYDWIWAVEHRNDLLACCSGKCEGLQKRPKRPNDKRCVENQKDNSINRPSALVPFEKATSYLP